MERTIVQIAYSVTARTECAPASGELIALCDDGTLWMLCEVDALRTLEIRA